MSHSVTHLHTPQTTTRPLIHINTHANPHSPHWQTTPTDPTIEAFHKSLPHYAATPLHSLPDIASQLGYRHVFVKDESTRFGLPSFKILGASWAIHRTLCAHLGLAAAETSLVQLTGALWGRDDVRIVTCTDGNWGRSVARMCKYLGVGVKVYVPGFMNDFVQGLIRGEGAEVEVLGKGSYDDSIAIVRRDAEATGALVVLDTSWEGYTEIPGWVTAGYSTMLTETDRQIAEQTENTSETPYPMVSFVSVGVGSWAHSVTKHYKALSSKANKIVTVEATAAPSFKESLHVGDIAPIKTGETIMNGMNCGTTSLLAWPVLRDGADAAVAVDDRASHEDVLYLQGKGIDAGPCGAANLAALRKLCDEAMAGSKEERAQQVVVLFSTEGNREYDVPE